MQNELVIKLKQSLIDKEYSIRLNQLLNGQQKLRKDQKPLNNGANQPITLLPSISNTKVALSQRHRSLSAIKIAASQSKLNNSKSNKRVLLNEKSEQNLKQGIKKQKIEQLITKKQGIEISANKQSSIRSKVFSFKTPYKEGQSQKQFYTQDASLKVFTESTKKEKQKKQQQRERQTRKKQLNQKLVDLEKDLYLILKNGKLDQESMDNKKIVNYFNKLKQANYQQYTQLQNKVNKTMALSQKYKIKKGIVFLKKLSQLKYKKVVSNAEILFCFNNFKEILQSTRIPGLEYYTQPPKNGRDLAANKIKSFFKMILSKKFYKNLRGLMKKVKIIQRFWRNCLLVRHTRRKMLEKANERIKRSNQVQQKFIADWNIIKTSQRIEVHVCSYSLQQFKKLTINHLRQRENSQITRVFRASQTDLTVIYVTPFHLTEEIMNYYKSLFNLNNRSIGNVFFVIPENLPKIQKQCSLITTVSALLYSPKALKRIKQIISSNYAYIVPSFPSVQFVNLSVQLNIPYFGPQQTLAKLYSTKSGSLKLLGNAAKRQKASFCLNKSVQGIHTERQLINTLSVLIYRNKQIKLWYLKIEDQINSRGLAYLNINKIAFLREVCEGGQWDGVQQSQMVALIAQQLTAKLQNRLKIINKDVYANYKQYITHFFTRGGIIEASFSSNESASFSIGLLIEPNGDFNIIGTYNKMQLGAKSINQAISFPSKLKNINYEGIARHVYKQVYLKQKLFGFLSADFVYREEDNGVAAIGMDLYLNEKLSSLFMVKFCCRANYDKDRNALINFKNQSLNFVYCPHLTLLRLPQLTIFFKNCKFQNISFDLQEQLGTFFILLDRFQNQQISFIVAQKSEELLLRQLKRVIDYFCQNFRAPKQAHDELGLLRGAITTGLKRVSKLKISLNNSNTNLE